MLLTTTQVTGSNHNLKYNKDRSSKAGLFLFPLLAYLWQVMEKYILSEIFTLIPKELYSRERGEAALKEQFSLSDGYIYNEYLLSSSNAVAAFALPQGNGPEVYPFIVRMLEEAAAIDGCRPTRTFFSVVLPMMKPTMISVAILEIMWVWNDYLLPYLVLDRTKYMTIPIHIQYLKGSYGTVDLGATMALILLSIIPVIVFYLSCQKHIIKGVAAGAVKG